MAELQANWRQAQTKIRVIARALQETYWSRKLAAQLLNMSYRGLLSKIRQHGITRTAGTAGTVVLHGSIVAIPLDISQVNLWRMLHGGHDGST